MVNRILGLILMGVIGIFTIAMPISALTGGDAPSPGLGIAAAFILTAVIAFTGRASSVWSRLCFINGLAALTLPLMAIAFSAMFAARGGSSIGAHAGAILGGAMLTGAAAFIGFFVGAIFLALAFFLRNLPVTLLPSTVAIAAAAKATEAGGSPESVNPAIVSSISVSPASVSVRSIRPSKRIPMGVALSALVGAVILTLLIVF